MGQAPKAPSFSYKTRECPFFSAGLFIAGYIYPVKVESYPLKDTLETSPSMLQNVTFAEDNIIADISS